eukprot:scaffold5610_cov137-Isochrysis_galbana.AAC.2
MVNAQAAPHPEGQAASARLWDMHEEKDVHRRRLDRAGHHRIGILGHGRYSAGSGDGVQLCVRLPYGGELSDVPA